MRIVKQIINIIYNVIYVYSCMSVVHTHIKMLFFCFFTYYFFFCKKLENYSKIVCYLR